ncbi:MAG: hypothetical protein IJT95_07385 [Abditibacteriota bacterium]|nr:hypothetical protein [Abditibacteriota bacterium]
MLKHQKQMWIKTVKLLSCDLAADFIDELECEDVYTREIVGSIRKVISRNMDAGDYDLWNTGLESSVPGKLLDSIEDEFGEETACDLEDYYLRMEKRLILFPVFEYWHAAFLQARDNDAPVALEADDSINEELATVTENYITYVEEFFDRMRKAEPASEWDKTLNGMGAIYMDESGEAVELNVVAELISEFAFCNIAYDFWLKITELLGDDADQLKTWAAAIMGEETLPSLPAVTEDEEDPEEEEDF